MTEDQARVHLMFMGCSMKEVDFHIKKIRKMNSIEAEKYIERLGKKKKP